MRWANQLKASTCRGWHWGMERSSTSSPIGRTPGEPKHQGKQAFLSLLLYLMLFQTSCNTSLTECEVTLALFLQKRLETKIVVKSSNSWPTMSTVFCCCHCCDDDRVWDLKTAAIFVWSKWFFFSCDDFIPESLRQHSRFFPLLCACVYIHAHIDIK